MFNSEGIHHCPIFDTESDKFLVKANGPVLK
jgi:hypothetical protein